MCSCGLHFEIFHVATIPVVGIVVRQREREKKRRVG